MKRVFGATTDAELDAFEVDNKIKLPSDYRTFLKEHNGGIPQDHEIEIPDWAEVQINEFCGLNLQGDIGKYYGLAQVNERFSDRFPIGEVVVIAADAGGNRFLIGVGKRYFGRVYFWDHEAWDDEAENCLPEMIEVAKTFDKFLNKIKWAS